MFWRCSSRRWKLSSLSAGNSLSLKGKASFSRGKVELTFSNIVGSTIGLDAEEDGEDEEDEGEDAGRLLSLVKGNVSSFSKGKVECVFSATVELGWSVTEVEKEAGDEEGRFKEVGEAEDR